MYKKIFVLIFVFSWFFGNNVNAWMISPYQYVNIVKNTVGGDGDFNFDLIGINANFSVWYDINPSIQTQNGTGQYNSDDIFVGVGGYYLIKEVKQPGWSLQSISCINDVYGEIGTVMGEYSKFPAYAYTTTTCTVTNKKQANKTPVLIVPGVMGTDIIKGNEKLWLDLGRNLTDVGDEFMDPMQFDQNLNPIDTYLNVGNLILNPFSGQHFYDQLIQEFQNQGYTQGTSSTDSLFLFPYDWRYGVSGVYSNGSTTVDMLKQKIDDIMVQTGSSKVDVVAHSTGGLLVKKYAISHLSDNHIGKAIFVGVPNTGAAKAIKVLLEGDSFGIPWLADSEMQKISKNLPVVYDLLPSEKYYTVKNSPIKVLSGNFFTSSKKELNYNEANSYLINDKNLNSQAVANAKSLHATNYDDFDLRTAGVDLYAIDGCKTGTLSQVLDFQKPDGTHVRYDLGNDTPGDGTVPLESSTNLPIDQSHKYYALQADHAKMPSQDGIRQQIVNIISGSQLSTQSSVLHKDLITQDISKCKLKGKAISVYSPLSIDITDQDGNHSGLLADGVSIQNDIPNADFAISGEHKFAYLPNDEGQTYAINLAGTGSGSFTIKNQDINNNQIIQTEVFSNLPVTTTLSGQVNLGSITTLSLDTNGDGAIDQIVQPSSILDSNQSQDLTVPISSSTITGTVGQPGFYRSNLSVMLSATDPIILGHETETSGVLKTQYSLDGGEYVAYDSSSPISLVTEGAHSIKFYSTDRAGNNEPEQELNFVIDKTPPELIIQFDPIAKDLIFTATDTLPSIVTATSTSTKIKWPKIPALRFTDSDSVITATDPAGNTIQLTLKDKDRKRVLKADIKSLTYNGQAVDISKAKLNFVWNYNKQGNLTHLTQSIQSKKNFRILVVYNGKKTTLAGLDAKGLILKTLNGLTLLKVTTAKGDLGWGY